MYYLAFLSISMAMLGMTAGALLVYFKFGAVNYSNIAKYLSRTSTAFALAILICFLLQIASPLPLLKTATIVIMWAKLIILLAVPFVFSGVIVSLALTRSPFPVGISYGVDLLGAATGCLSVLLVLNFLDAVTAMFGVAALAALGGWFFNISQRDELSDTTFPYSRLLKRPEVIAIGLVALGVANFATPYGFQLVSAKLGTRIEIGKMFEYDRWNSFSRILVAHSEQRRPFLWGGSSTLPTGISVPQRGLNIDGFASTDMPQFNGDPTAVNFLKFGITNLAYAARPTGRVAVIGVGSGRDLLSAHTFGATDITGIEVNPIFVDLLTDHRKLRKYAGIADIGAIRRR
jgi:hypothetical protein